MLALLFLASTYGCASLPPQAATLDPGAQFIELTATPFFPQERYQCGPAALTTVLVQSGKSTTLDSMIDAVYIPDRQGSLQLEMLAAARGEGRIPYRIEPTLGAIHRELIANRPVLVLQNLGIRAIPRWHYAVVVGIDPDNNAVYLRSGQERRRKTRLRTFVRTWQRSDFWGVVVLPPGELPQQPDAARFAAAVAAFESAGRHEQSIKSWRAGLAEWPQDTTMLFGTAGAAYATSDFAAAARLYRRIIEIDDRHVFARNNLAMALAEEGRFDEAIDELDIAMKLDEISEQHFDILQATRFDIERLRNKRR